MSKKYVTLSIGGGGKQTTDFIKDVIIKNFDNEILTNMSDAAHLLMSENIAFTTDSFVIKPEFFNKGNIGKLSICGTVNDLAVSGAIPKYLSFGLIVEEGYPFDKLEEIIKLASDTAKNAGVKIVCGDTKVIEKGGLDGIIINTTGIGEVVKNLCNYNNIEIEDCIILTSDIARHGISIILSRGDLGFIGDIKSDCTCLNKMLEKIYDFDIKFARDATRGGLSAVLNEIADKSNLGFEIEESLIPIERNVLELCDTLGFDPLGIANEGVAVLIVSKEDSEKILKELHKDINGKKAVCIGKVTGTGRVVLKTNIGGKRYVEMPPGELLPRIC